MDYIITAALALVFVVLYVGVERYYSWQNFLSSRKRKPARAKSCEDDVIVVASLDGGPAYIPAAKVGEMMAEWDAQVVSLEREVLALRAKLARREGEEKEDDA